MPGHFVLLCEHHPTDGDYGMSAYLEDHYPHVLPGLTENWGKPEDFKKFIASLVFDTRGGRTGWPPEAWEEVSFLEALHNMVYPTDHRNAEDILLDDTIKWVS
jgi:hypothetical protein